MRQYGYFTPYQKEQKFTMLPNQNIAGFPIGILYIEDVWYPMVPGNVVNGYTFDFPVRYKAVEGLNVPDLFQMAPSAKEAILNAAKSLQTEGVRAISAACGFFGNYQSFLAKELDIPVAVSSLVQIPWIQVLLKPDQKVGILTADKGSFSKHLLESCGVMEDSRIVVTDMRQAKEFSCVVEQRGEMDNQIAQQEIVEQAVEMVRKDPSIGAILLECSDMPPYAYAVQAAVKLPVFDFTTLIRWLYNATTQKPYYGFI